MAKSIRFKQLSRHGGSVRAMQIRTDRRRERNNKTVQHINNGLVSTLSRAERKIQDAFNNIPSRK